MNIPPLTRAVPTRHVILASLLALTSATAQQPALAATLLSLNSPTGSPGGSAPVQIQIQSDASPVAVQFDLRYDTNLLAFGIAAAGPVSVGHHVESSTPEPGVERVVIYSIENRPLANGLLATVPLRVNPAAPVGANTPLTISNLLAATAVATLVPGVSGTGGTVTFQDTFAPSLDYPILAANGQVTLRVRGQGVRIYTVQRSVDLLTWETIHTAAATDGILTFSDATAPTRRYAFYRAIEAP